MLPRARFVLAFTVGCFPDWLPQVGRMTFKFTALNPEGLADLSPSASQALPLARQPAALVALPASPVLEPQVAQAVAEAGWQQEEEHQEAAPPAAEAAAEQLAALLQSKESKLLLARSRNRRLRKRVRRLLKLVEQLREPLCLPHRLHGCTAPVVWGVWHVPS